MSKKYTKRYAKPEGWQFKNNFLAGTEWSVKGSKADSFYTVALSEQGFSCNCYGFQYYGKCKHSKQIIERFEHA